MGLWGYFASEAPSFTALIPVFAGIILLVLTRGIMKANSVIAHGVVILTFILMIALIKPLTGAISRDDSTAVMRVVVMMLTSLLALVVYSKSFIDARRQRVKG